MKKDTIRMIFGFMLLMSLVGLSAVVALGHVEEATSHGLMPLVTSISVLAGGFANYAFQRRQKSEKKKKKKLKKFRKVEEMKDAAN